MRVKLESQHAQSRSRVTKLKFLGISHFASSIIVLERVD